MNKKQKWIETWGYLHRGDFEDLMQKAFPVTTNRKSAKSDEPSDTPQTFNGDTTGSLWAWEDRPPFQPCYRLVAAVRGMAQGDSPVIDRLRKLAPACFNLTKPDLASWIQSGSRLHERFQAQNKSKWRNQLQESRLSCLICCGYRFQGRTSKLERHSSPYGFHWSENFKQYNLRISKAPPRLWLLSLVWSSWARSVIILYTYKFMRFC